MSHHVPVITSDESGVVDGHAWIAPDAAWHLQNLLVRSDWRDYLKKRGLSPADAAGVEQAVAALFVAGSQRAGGTVAAGGNAATNGNAVVSGSLPWTTRQTAGRLRRTERRVRQMAQRGELEAVRIGGRWTFDERDVAAYAARHATAE